MPIRRSEILLAKFLIYTVGRSQPYAYEQCDKNSTRSYGLRAYMLTHSGDHLYACEECDKSFTVYIGMKDHMRSYSREKPHNCEKCDQSFTKSEQLKIYMMSYSGERPYTYKLYFIGRSEFSFYSCQ